MTPAPTPPGLVSILIVNWRTPVQTRLCLRSLRAFTRAPHEVIVVDNESGDASADYLASLDWIKLIVNSGEQSHRAGLELARAEARGEWLLALHTDTFVARPGWLERLLAETGPETCLVGSSDRVLMPMTTPLDRLSLWWTRRKQARRWAREGRSPKLLSHCLMVRRAFMIEHGLRFDRPVADADGRVLDCGEPLQRYCEEQGLAMRALGREQLGEWMWHFEAATLNLKTGRKVPLKRRLRSWRFYRQPEILARLADDSLDR